MNFIKRYNIGRMICFSIVLVIFLFFCYAAAFSKDDGVVLESSSEIFLAKTFNVFLFPTCFLFGDYMNDVLFLAGLLVNCFFYAFLIESIIVLSINLKRPG